MCWTATKERAQRAQPREYPSRLCDANAAHDFLNEHPAESTHCVKSKWPVVVAKRRIRLRFFDRILISLSKLGRIGRTTLIAFAHVSPTVSRPRHLVSVAACRGHRRAGCWRLGVPISEQGELGFKACNEPGGRAAKHQVVAAAAHDHAVVDAHRVRSRVVAVVRGELLPVGGRIAVEG